MIAVGLMSGTSLDGIDAVRIAVHPRSRGYHVETQAFATLPFDVALRKRVLAAYPPSALDALALSSLHADVGAAFAHAALAAGAGDADYIASHGLTLAHDGDAHHTLQIGDPFRIREATGRTVIYDFRSADTAAGGFGAPLVPYVDALLLGHASEVRVALNLGGIANLTVLTPGAAPDAAIAFDCGPGNLPIDSYVELRTGGKVRFDRAGAFARAGSADATLLDGWLADPYFARQPPKTTGRERFGAPFIERQRAALDALPFADAVRTLTELTIRSVTAAICRHAPAVVRTIVSGGGAHNLTILDGLRAGLPGTVETSGVYGIDPDAKEAVAFALLGYETLRERPAGLPRVTGARGPRVLGAIAPAALAALFARVRAEESPDE
ncbi:MAG TPA: anhydro-N-acetylmuramic acid kinase [Candidatus Lustribacter sp.]